MSGRAFLTAATWTGTAMFKRVLDWRRGVTGWVWREIRRTVRIKMAER